MKREDIEFWLVVVVGIALIIVAIKFFISLLPIIIVALIGLLIYDSYKKHKNVPVKSKEKKVKEAEVIKEKNNE